MKNRKIKFKAWDTKSKIFIADVIVDSQGVWEQPDRTYDTPNREIELMPHLIPLQWTGCEDKDGHSVYEGHIGISNQGTRFVVLWLEDLHGFYMKTSLASKKAYEFRDYMMNEFKIIGNIYENPELLLENFVEDSEVNHIIEY